MIQKCCSPLWAKANLKQTDAKWTTVEIVFGIHGCHILQTKEERDHPVCYQHLYWIRGALVPMELATCSFKKAPSVLRGFRVTIQIMYFSRKA